MWQSLSAPKTIGIGAVLIVALYTARLLLRSRKNKRKIKRIIDTIDELQRPSVRIKDPNLVEDKICQLIKGGRKKLQVISDFDMTLTRFHLNGKQCSSCHGAIENSSKMPQDYREKVQSFKKFYYPIEIDITLTSEEKAPFMVEWWSKAHNVLLETDLNKADLKDMVRESNIHLRDGCHSFFELLYENDVPLTIFSAGLGNILEEVIRQQAIFYDNIQVISNYMNFDENGKLKSFQDNMIHAFNKNSYNVISTNNAQNLAECTNVLLIGDSLGDINMDAGLQTDTILRIGFLNSNIEICLQKYMENFDIVLVNDQTMDIVNAITRKIL